METVSVTPTAKLERLVANRPVRTTGQPEIAPNHLSARPELVAGNDGDGTR